MEKYRKWTDGATGINPFVPYQKPRAVTSILFKLFQIIRLLLFTPIILTLKFSLLFIFSLFLLPINNIFGSIRPLLRYFNFIFGRSILYVLGFWNIKTTYLQHNNLREIELSNAQKIGKFWSDCQSGDLILSNHISYVDVLYFASRYSPRFAIVEFNNKTEKYSIKCLTWLQYLLLCISQQDAQPLPQKEYTSLSQIVREAKAKSWGPIILFYEGTTTNGRGILSPDKRFWTEQNNELQRTISELKTKLYYVIFEYKFENFSPAYHVPGIWGHISALCAQLYNKLSITVIEFPVSGTSITPIDFGNEIVKHYTKSTGKLELKTVNKQNKTEFIDYWNKTQTTNYTE